MSVYSRVRPHRHLRRDGATWCGINIHAGVALLKPGINPAATGDRVCRRCTKASVAAQRQPELAFRERPKVTPIANLRDLLEQAGCSGGSK